MTDDEIAEKLGKIIVSTYPRVGEKGGMSIFRTEVGVQITHIGTGVSVIVDSERNQYKNRSIALRQLYERVKDMPSYSELYDIVLNLKLACELGVHMFLLNDVNVPNTIETMEDAINKADKVKYD
jgi:hypothetical protein